MRIFLAMIATLFFSTQTFASCSDYYNGLRQHETAAAKLMSTMPGTAISLMSCLGGCSNQPQSERAGCALAACGLICIAIGFEHCTNFVTRAAALDLHKKRLRAYGRHHGCIN